MDISIDYKDLFSILNKYRVRFLVVGAYAVVYYTEPRFTKDLDIWVDAGLKNAERIYRSLKEFGAPLKNIQWEDFTNKNMVYQIGVEPIRVDVIMGLPCLNFNSAWKNRSRSKYADIPINIMGIGDLIKAKKHTKRPHDIIDLNRLIKEYNNRKR